MIEIHTLGSIDLLERTDGHQILSVLAQPKRVAFLTYLAIASPRGLHQRDTLLGIFWPDSTEKKARNALNQTVFVLRRALGHQLFRMNGEPGVGVERDQLWCDVWEFEGALASGEKETALDLYKGNFLEGFLLPGCVEFDRWADLERGRLRDLATGAVLSLSQDMESAGNPVGAVGWLRRAREWAVYDESVLNRQVELLLALGDRSGAVREYESFARRLSVDLGLEPSEEGRRLLDRPEARARGWQAAGVAEKAVPPPPPPDPWPVSGTRKRFSLAQAVALAGFAGVMGLGAALLAPRVWDAASSTADPIPEQSALSRKVVVLPLENATGNPALDPLGRTAAEEILQELSTAGLASVGPGPTSGGEGVGSGSQSSSTSQAGIGMWTLKDADYLVMGSYSELNGRLVYQARIMDAESGTIALAVDSVLGSLAEPFEATRHLKQHVAGALAMIMDSRLSSLMGVASPPRSFRAYQLLTDGLDLLDRGYRT